MVMTAATAEEFLAGSRPLSHRAQGSNILFGHLPSLQLLKLVPSGFQISLNYKSKFSSKWVPNSSRIRNECDLLCARTFQCICCFSCFLASARRVALVLGGRLGKVRPALRKAGRAFSLRGKFPYISPLFLCARAEI